MEEAVVEGVLACGPVVCVRGVWEGRVRACRKKARSRERSMHHRRLEAFWRRVLVVAGFDNSHSKLCRALSLPVKEKEGMVRGTVLVLCRCCV